MRGISRGHKYQLTMSSAGVAALRRLGNSVNLPPQRVAANSSQAVVNQQNRSEVVRRLQCLIDFQKKKLDQAASEKDRQRIIDSIERFKAEIEDPSSYL